MRLLVLFCLLVLMPTLSASGTAKPIVSIIIDDMGYRYEQDARVLSLPGAVTFSILPDGPGVKRILDAAGKSGNEVMLHLPMESNKSQQHQSPGELTMDMNWITFVRTVQANLAAVPGIVAVNNHQGSQLTADPERMQWLMRELSNHKDIAFIDSRTTHHTVALEVARKYGLAATRRDVFLDYAPGKIEQQFDELINRAKQQGSALAIAHPHEETISFLTDNMHRLQQQGIELVPVSQLIAKRQQLFKLAGR
jgi:polysaccharide deacetylase 2 family uncharacterized protein YibQ